MNVVVVMKHIREQRMTIREYQDLLGNLIAERDRIFNQISMVKNEKERKHHFSMYQVSTNASMIREVSTYLTYHKKWHIE